MRRELTKRALCRTSGGAFSLEYALRFEVTKDSRVLSFELVLGPDDCACNAADLCVKPESAPQDEKMAMTAPLG